MKLLAVNKKARFDYEILETLTAGIILSGSEAKSAKLGAASLSGSYIKIIAGEPVVLNLHITPYKYSGGNPSDPAQTRKLLLKKEEIDQLTRKEKGGVIIPLELFATGKGLVKLKVGIGRGRKKQDKREYIKKRDDKREAKNFI